MKDIELATWDNSRSLEWREQYNGSTQGDDCQIFIGGHRVLEDTRIIDASGQVIAVDTGHHGDRETKIEKSGEYGHHFKEETDSRITKLMSDLELCGWRSESNLVRSMFDSLNAKQAFDADVEELLTELEREAMNITADLWNTMCKIVGDGESRGQDMREIIFHIHALRHTIMGQVAARAYGYRLLGDDAPSVTIPAAQVGVARPLTGYGSKPKIHVSSHQDFAWDCNTRTCGRKFMAKQCLSSHCYSHSMTNCPECNNMSTLLSAEQPSADDESKQETELIFDLRTTWYCSNTQCSKIFFKAHSARQSSGSSDGCPSCGKYAAIPLPGFSDKPFDLKEVPTLAMDPERSPIDRPKAVMFVPRAKKVPLKCDRCTYESKGLQSSDQCICGPQLPCEWCGQGMMLPPKRAIQAIHMLYQPDPEDVGNPLCGATEGNWWAATDITKVNCQECLVADAKRFTDGKPA